MYELYSTPTEHDHSLEPKGFVKEMKHAFCFGVYISAFRGQCVSWGSAI